MSRKCKKSCIFIRLKLLYICMQKKNFLKNYRCLIDFLGIIQIFVVLLFLLESCSSTPKKEKVSIPEPQWITDKKGVFPDSEYLAQLGTGANAAEARNNSIAQLASYFNTNVKSLVQGETYTYNTQNDESKTERTIKSSVVTYTDLDLFALETAEPYYLIREQKWYCCAYINRKTAWNQYEPYVRDAKNKFYSIFSLAQKTQEPLERIKIYSQAEFASEEFLGCLYRAYMFSKPLTDQAFGDDRAVVASIPGYVQKEKNNCIMCAAVENDMGGIISSTINKIFSGMDFTMSDNLEKAYYTVDIRIDYGRLTEDDLVIYFPSVKVSIKSKEKTLYVYENKLDRIMHYNESKAQTKALDGIAALLEKELAADFKTSMGLSE